MRPETSIARRLYYKQEEQSRSSRPAIRVAVAGIVIGMTVMILTLCVVIGFKRTVTDKVACFGAHIQVVNFDNNNTYEMKPVEVTDSLLGVLRAISHITEARAFLTKPGIIKTDIQFQGIVLKAADDWSRFASSLTEGHLPESDKEVLLSESLCRKLLLKTGDEVYCYFVGHNVRVRRWRIAGVYSTGFEEADSRFILAESSVVRQLNGWDDSKASGIELYVDDLSRLEETADRVWYATANHLDKDGNAYYSQTLEQLNPAVFAWLDLLDMNVIVIIVLMLLVSGFNIISGLIILILDNIYLIGVLKALGAADRFVRRIFITEASMLVGKGMIWGNLLGLGLAALQYFTRMVPLDAATYYIGYVPIAFPWLQLVLLNVGVALVTFLIILAPSAIAKRISPAQVMRYD
ncbi:MAG: ABC transporter permease [Paludibacteraceae bacterium]|nr:ABC transporter permease [Paludibacteraceae bacterium]